MTPVLDTSRARVTRCALSRICGACGESLGRPIALLGTEEEQRRNAFHGPPLHLGCARRFQGSTPGLAVLVTTAGFEFERPGRDDLDQRVRLLPNSLLGPGASFGASPGVSPGVSPGAPAPEPEPGSSTPS